MRQDKSRSRVTPKKEHVGPSGVSREPVKVGGRFQAVVPILMFACMGIGLAIIVTNYMVEDFMGAPSNTYLLIGLGFILAGIVAATRYE